MDKKHGLLATLLKGWAIQDKVRRETSLGDRTKYVGMSDVGAAVTCLRQAVGSKLTEESIYPDAESIQKMDTATLHGVLERAMILNRGHWQEIGIDGSFTALGGKVIRQLEILCPLKDEETEIRVHLDFVLVFQNAVRVIESKCNNRIPESLHASYEAQVYGQIGLLHRMWAEKVFTVRDEKGDVLGQGTFPEVVKSLFGLDLPETPVSIEGWVLSMSMKEVEPFGPYLPSDVMTDFTLNTAVKVWDHFQAVRHEALTLNDVEYARGFNPLCDYCAFSHDCPKFKDIEQPDLAESLAALKALKDQSAALKAKIDEQERFFREAYEAINPKGEKASVLAGDLRFRVSCQFRSSFNQEKLKGLLMGMGWTEEAVADLMAQAMEPYTVERFYISKANTPRPKAKRKVSAPEAPLPVDTPQACLL